MDWKESTWQRFETEVKEKEKELIDYRKEHFSIEKSSFSYYLYEKKAKDYQKEWEELRELKTEESYERLKDLRTRRINELLHQDYINQDDFPKEKKVQQLAAERRIWAEKWKRCSFAGD